MVLKLASAQLGIRASGFGKCLNGVDNIFPLPGPATGLGHLQERTSRPSGAPPS